jgi:hypothetical protein
VGFLLYGTGRLSASSDWYRAWERSAWKENNLNELQVSLGNQANILYARGDLDGSMALMQEQERIYRELGNLDGLTISLVNQADIHRLQETRRQPLLLSMRRITLQQGSGM